MFVSRLTADKPGALSFTVTLDRPERFETTAPANNELLMTGTLNDGRGGKGVSYAARLRVLARGGSVKAERNRARRREAPMRSCCCWPPRRISRALPAGS